MFLCSQNDRNDRTNAAYRNGFSMDLQYGLPACLPASLSASLPPSLPPSPSNIFSCWATVKNIYNVLISLCNNGFFSGKGRQNDVIIIHE